MRVVVATDKFRGFSSAAEASENIASGIREGGLQCEAHPVADGGEGTLRSVHAVTGGEWIDIEMADAWEEKTTARILQVPSGETLVEAADVVGIHRRPASSKPQPPPSSAALGRLILAASEYATQQLTICVGGTATVDGGWGATEELYAGLPPVPVVVAADVQIGYYDAVRTFGAQKGLTAADMDSCDRHLQDAGLALSKKGNGKVRLGELAGGGAGGGIAGALACVGANVRGGFAEFCRLTGFADIIRNADVVITGEGRADRTTWLGKAPGEVIRLAQKNDRATGIVVGGVTPDARQSFADACVSIVSLEELSRELRTSITEKSAALLCRMAGRATAEVLTKVLGS